MSAARAFSLRVRLGQCEVEISGSKDEVLSAVKDLPNLVAVISEAFSQAGVEASQVETAAQSVSPTHLPQTSASAPIYPSIQSSGGCADAVLRLLSTDWGRTAPRTLPEIVEAMRANAVHHPVTTLSGVLNWLVRRGKVKRWKTDKGYVYVLSETNVVPSQSSIQSETVEASAGGG